MSDASLFVPNRGKKKTTRQRDKSHQQDKRKMRGGVRSSETARFLNTWPSSRDEKEAMRKNNTKSG